MTRYIVSDEHKFVYFSVPKVACSSIKVALLPLFDLDTTGYRGARGKSGNNIMMHQLFRDSGYQINKRQLLEKLKAGEYQNYFKFAFVRNPWDRILSCWRHKLSEKDSPGMEYPTSLAESVYPGMPFSEFVEVVASTPDSKANPHFQSQSSMIYGDLDGGREKALLSDFVGHFENLQEDFEYITKKIGAQQELSLGHLMRRSTEESRPYNDFYDENLHQLVHERYRDDISKFGYSF